MESQLSRSSSDSPTLLMTFMGLYQSTIGSAESFKDLVCIHSVELSLTIRDWIASCSGAKAKRAVHSRLDCLGTGMSHRGGDRPDANGDGFRIQFL